MQSLTSLREVGKVKLIGRVYSCPWFSRPVTHGLSGTPVFLQAGKTSGCVSSAVLQEAPSAGSGAARGRGARRRMPSPGSRLCRHPREPRQPAACWCRRHGRCAAALRPRDPGGAPGQRPPRARPVPPAAGGVSAPARPAAGPSRPIAARSPGSFAWRPPIGGARAARRRRRGTRTSSAPRAGGAGARRGGRAVALGGAPRAGCSPPAAAAAALPFVWGCVRWWQPGGIPCSPEHQVSAPSVATSPNAICFFGRQAGPHRAVKIGL